MGFNGGHKHENVHKIIRVTTTPYTITPDQSGFTFISENPLTPTFILPEDTTGIGFHCTIINPINVNTGVTGRHFKISTAGDGQLMLGAIATVGAGAKQDVFLPNGSSHDNILMDATAEGGGAGMWFECILVGVDKWLIHGHGMVGSSAAPTNPWSNS
jgi:hypothetical protein